MKIGFDAKRLYRNFTGLGNYSRTLLENLAEFFPQNDYFLYASTSKETPRTKSFFDAATYQLRFSNKKPAALWRSFGIKKDLAKDKLDIFHGLSGELPHLGKNRPKTIVTIHDLIFRHFPKQYGPINTAIYDRKAGHACRTADIVIAISESTKRDLIQFYGIPEAKIEVLYQGCDGIFYEEKDAEEIRKTKEQLGLPSKYIVSVGSIIERKKLLELVKSYQHIDELHKVPLVVIGKGSDYAQKVKKYVAANPELQPWIIFTKDIPFSDFPAIYQGAEMLVYPSVYEGFGIPVIEALVSGIPVITSSKSSLPEAGGPASVYIDEVNPINIASAISKVLADPQLREKMITQGKQHVQKFEKEKITTQLVGIYEKLLSE